MLQVTSSPHLSPTLRSLLSVLELLIPDQVPGLDKATRDELAKVYRLTMFKLCHQQFITGSPLTLARLFGRQLLWFLISLHGSNAARWVDESCFWLESLFHISLEAPVAMTVSFYLFLTVSVVDP